MQKEEITFDFKIMASSSSSNTSSENVVKVNVQMPDIKNQKKGRKHQMIFYISDEDIKYLKKKTRFTEGELRYVAESHDKCVLSTSLCY